MYKSIRIQNYRCLRDVTLELGSFTVLVGPNASGKTALADALTAGTPSKSDHWRSEESRPKWQSPAPGGKVRHFGGLSAKKFELSPSVLRRNTTADEHYQLGSAGEDLPNLFDTLSRERQEAFVNDLVALVPVYADLKARARGGKKRLQFEDLWKPGHWYEPEQVSDGTMLAAAFVALGYQRDVPDLIVIEDPDRGLHPYLQRQVVELLRKLSTGEIGPKPIQVVLTTHSKAMLDVLEPDEVRFISRTRDTGETVIQRAPTDNPKWRELYERYDHSLGDLWLTGALGGVPGK